MGATEGKQPYARNLRTLDLTKTCSTAKPTVYDIRNERQRVQLTLARYLARTGSLHGFWPATELEGKALQALLKTRPHLGIPAKYKPDHSDMEAHSASLREHRRQAVSAGLDPRHLPRINSEPSLFLLESFGSDVDSVGQLETSLFNLAWPPTHMVDSVTAPDPPAETSPASAYTLQELEIMAPGEIQVHYEFPQSGGFAPQDQDILTAQYLAASSEPYQQTVPGVPLVPYTYTPHTHHVQDGLWEWEAITEVSSTGSGGPNEPQQTPPQASFWVCTPPEPQPAGFSSWH